MIAVKVYETEKNDRKMRSVKLVAADGTEMLADSHTFDCKPWEIQGQMFDVLTRTSKEGNVRAHEIVSSEKKVEDEFPLEVGFVDSYDAQHGHYHIFDTQSRHFVAEKPKVNCSVGGYVWFVPVIPKDSKFKSAIVVRTETQDAGRDAFGPYSAIVKYINQEKGFFYYKILSDLPSTDEGVITDEGSAQLSLASNQLVVGQEIRLIMFLKRGKDGTKRNHVVEIL